MKIGKILNHKKELQEVFLSFIQDTDDINDILNLKLFLETEQIQANHTELKHFLYLILNICNNHHRPPNLYDKLIRIFNLLKKSIKQTFSNSEIFEIFASNKLILLCLFNEQIITMNQDIADYFIEEDEINSNHYCHFFFPEIQIFIDEEKISQIETELVKLDANYQTNFDHNRRQGENETYICYLIRNDLVEKFIAYININKISLNCILKPSIYETNAFLNEHKNITFIEYATFFGSIQIFQFLLFNSIKVKEELSLYAIHSNNHEFIHLLESNHVFFNKIEALLESIKCHHNELASYIKDNLKNQSTNEKEEINDCIFESFNYCLFPSNFETSSSFFYLFKYEYSNILKLFLDKEMKKVKRMIRLCSDLNLLIRKSAKKNKLHIVYCLLLDQNQINKNFFKNCSNLTKMVIPPTIKTIEENSFCNCSSLTDILIPSTVKLIGRAAFFGCKKLRQINIPNSIKSIGSHAFRNCSSLQQISLPSSIKQIEPCTFYGCIKMRKIKLSKSIQSVGQLAFYDCQSLIGIDLSDSLLSIGNHSFCNCSSILKITLSESVTSIGQSAFKRCSSLEHIFGLSSSLQSIGSYAFKGCKNLMKFSIPFLITSIEESTFKNCSSLSQITIPSSIKSIGKDAFNGCSSLLQIPIPSSVKYIGEGAFNECSSLTEIIIPSLITSIEDSTFKNCSLLSQITIPSSIKSIGKDAFNGCSSLLQIPIPSSVKYIGEGAFNECSSLTEIIIPSLITSIKKSTFKNCSLLSQITIPSSIKSIEKDAFNGCSSLLQIPIPPSVKYIGEGAFNECSSLTEIIIPSLITSIEDSTFKNCSLLSQITIPSSIKSIGKDAFNGCSSLLQIPIPPSVKYIGEGAFNECSSLTEITIPSSVKLIGWETKISKNLFKGCSSLKNISIDSSFTHIDDFAFYDCALLEQITLSSSITLFGEYAFNISPNIIKNIKNIKLLYQNGLNKVHKIEDDETDDTFEAKVFTIKSENFSCIFHDRVSQYMFDMLKLNHPLIQKTIEFKENEFNNDSIFIILSEYINLDTLEEVIYRDKLNNTQKLIIIYGIASSMSYLHSKNIIHGNLNPLNILEDKKYHPKLINYGIKSIFNNNEKEKEEEDNNNEDEKNECLQYLAPELRDNASYTKACDVYSFGRIIQKIITNDDENIQFVYEDLILKCTSIIPFFRPTFDQILEELTENTKYTDNDVDEDEFNDFIEYIESSLESTENNQRGYQIIENKKENKRIILFKNTEEENKSEKLPYEITKNIKKIKLNNYFYDTEIGKGGFSNVYKAFKKNEKDKIYALKIFRLNEYKELATKQINRGIHFASILLHPSIIRTIGYTPIRINNNNDQIAMLMTFIPHGSLAEIIENEKKGVKQEGWNYSKKLIVLYGIAASMLYMHSHDIIHRDLKAENILIDNKFYPYLCDLGRAIKIDDIECSNEKSLIGTFRYFAPEVYKKCLFSKASDVFAFGMLSFHLLTTNVPFDGFLNWEIMYKVSVKSERPKFEKPIENCFKKLIKNCWKENPEDRPTFEQIVNQLKTDNDFREIGKTEFKRYINLIDQSVDGIMLDSLTNCTYEFK